MECVLSGNQIKLLSRAVNCLARVGNELLIEALPDKVSNHLAIEETTHSFAAAFFFASMHDPSYRYSSQA
jgi:cell cycle checkpoint control protein RAD9A